MKKLKVVVSMLAALGTLFASSPAMAKAVECNKAKVAHIYNDADKVFIQLEGLSWHVLGFKGDNDLSEKLAIIREAEEGGHYIRLEFPEGYDDSCLIMDESVAVEKVKLQKRKSKEDQE